MKLTQHAREGTNMKKKTDVESGACGQKTLEDNELCRSSGALVRRSEKEREHLFIPELRF